jgi:hypothetical protein
VAPAPELRPLLFDALRENARGHALAIAAA